MLWTIVVILFALWVIGLVAHVAGALIHFLLVVALAIVVFKMLRRRRTV